MSVVGIITDVLYCTVIFVYVQTL